VRADAIAAAALAAAAARAAVAIVAVNLTTIADDARVAEARSLAEVAADAVRRANAP
jgi:formiminotetrahydrofolate cyclodeaminase